MSVIIFIFCIIKDGSINAENTMETLNPWYHHNLGQRTGLSFLDAKAINMAYCQGNFYA